MEKKKQRLDIDEQLRKLRVEIKRADLKRAEMAPSRILPQQLKKQTRAPRDIPRWFANHTWPRSLLISSPLELETEILDARDHKDSVFEFLLNELEEEAQRILKTVLPVDLTEERKIKDLL